MRLAAVGSNCIDYYNNIDGRKAFPGGRPGKYGSLYTTFRRRGCIYWTSR